MARKIRSTWMKVTPAKAREWLDNANIGNRGVSKVHVKRLAKDMRRGDWGNTPEAIAFDVNGRLIDGQHRLHAIIESDRTIEIWVVTDCDVDAQKYIDAGRKRSLVDAYRFYEGEDLTKRAEGIVKAMMDFRCGYGYTRKEEAEFYKKHHDAIQFACKNCGGSIVDGSGKRKRIVAAVASVVARAFYTTDPVLLERFCEIVRDGLSSSKSDVAAVRLRDALLSDSAESTRGRLWTYRRAEYLLSMFIKRSRRVSASVIADCEMFPIPGEAEYKAAS